MRYLKYFRISLCGVIICALYSEKSDAQVEFNYRSIENYIGHTIVSDIDGDGRNDLILHEHTDPFHIKVDGRKPRLSWFKYPDYKNYTIAYADFMGDRFAVEDINSDGSQDVISAVALDTDYEGPKEIYWYQNPTPETSPIDNQSWKGHLIGTHEGAVKDIKAGDIDGNGKPDIVIRSHDFTSIFFQVDKSWVNRKIPHQRKEGLDLADIDLDGDLDIILNGFWFETPGNPLKDDFVFHSIDEKWYTQNDGTWQDNNCYVGAADLNKDGIPDIILAHSEKEGYPLSWYSVTSIDKVKTGPWVEQHIVAVFDWCETVDIGDIDNDGALDIMAAKFRRHNKPGEGTWNLPPYPISVFYNKRGDASVWTRQDIDQEGIYAGSLGDLGSDGDLDIVGPLSYFTAPLRIWENKTSDHKRVLNSWTYIKADSSRERITDKDRPNGLKTFGLDMSDVTKDGYKDIVAGRYFYRNPEGNMTGLWPRSDLGSLYDGVLFTDVDGDEYGDIIAQHFPGVYWLEAEDTKGKSWKAMEIGTLPPTGHLNSQGHETAQIMPGGKPEIIIATEEGLFYFEIPKDPMKIPWPKIKVASGHTMDEGIGFGDIDGDGFIDLAVGKVYGNEKARGVVWYKNTGNGTPNWEEYPVTTTSFHPDRIRIADINGDGRQDVIITEERWPGKEPDASMYWVEQDIDAGAIIWKRHTIVTQYTMNNLDVADVDRDGDIDIITCEHKGPNEQLQIWENDGKGNFLKHVIDRGKESHLGSQFADLDNDGDLDIVSTAWDDYHLLHVWRNNSEALSDVRRVEWNHLTSQLSQVPRPNVGRQAAALAVDIDKNGSEDIVVAGWSSPSMVWLRKTDKGWDRYIIDDSDSHIEAGGDVYDIDGDGDLDILQGGSWATNEVWWWENPYPVFEIKKVWKRHTIKNTGEKQHHDQLFVDLDGDKKAELVFWNQRARTLVYAKIPANPTKQADWKFNTIWTWPQEFKYEGLAKADIDKDGKEDLIGGGHWFKYEGNGKFRANKIDDYGSSRSAAGDIIKRGHPEVVLGSGDAIGPLNLYEWDGKEWLKTTLIDVVDNGHTLQVGDINGDGNPDIYAAEMYRPGSGDECRQWILYGNGKGQFDIQVLTIGIGTHEGKLGDLDGDGDIDILQKDFQETRRVDVWFNNGVK
ncbi:MAG: hypothetical protein A2X03_03770 [Bacteroidetes bacterium GWA2_40_15]|nr:MAG: hypothetical protein A2X03_03770 [Bacteroidetes bacterium GWA2_40_15]